ncbi:LLM class flavin-dependent oxidoreductase [Nostoc sp.]|uniref:LLM class flavin-dependent oxidoreductase n=1 Tax=Nostoc sp. TaxID=1180 RepID=UPI002FF6DBBC
MRLDRNNFSDVVIGANYNVADAWITAALASLNTKNIKIVAAVQPGFKLPAVVANLSANIQNQLSNGRFALSGIAGWWKLEIESYGDIWLPHSDRYARLEEYIDVIKGLWTVEGFNYVGKYYTIAFPNHIRYIIAPSSLAGRGLGVGLLYLTRVEKRYIKGGILADKPIPTPPIFIAVNQIGQLI